MHAGNYTLALTEALASREQHAPARISGSLAAMATGTYVPNRFRHNKMLFQRTCFSKKYWSAPSRSLFDNKFGRIFSTCERSMATHEQRAISRQGTAFLSAWLVHTPENLADGSEDVPRKQNRLLSDSPFKAIAHTSFEGARPLMPK